MNQSEFICFSALKTALETMLRAIGSDKCGEAVSVSREVLSEINKDWSLQGADHDKLLGLIKKCEG